MKISKPLYYILNCTWGLLMTLVGAFAALGLMVTGHKPKRHAGAIYFNVGRYWGGADLGLFFLTDRADVTSVKNHEFGHSLQNCLWGPLLPFVVCLPSAARYWLREFKTQKDRECFAHCIIVISATLMVLVSFIGVMLNQIWIFYLMNILNLYAIGLACWLIFIEIPKYQESIPEYDSIWFEGQATRWGTKVAKEW